MSKETAIRIFEEKQVRSLWNEDEEKWYFSIIDIVAILTDSVDASAYWRKLKQRLKEEGNETVTNCHTLKMQAIDGKMRLTDVADTEQLFRLIQSVPSPKAEPFKLWIAKVARERINEIEDPEIGIDRLMETYLKKGCSKIKLLHNKAAQLLVIPEKKLKRKLVKKLSHLFLQRNY